MAPSDFVTASLAAESLKPRRGAFIAIEGCDRSGKSTQVQRLQEVLDQAGIDYEIFRYPDRSTPSGRILDTYLKGEVQLDDHALHLQFSANRWESCAKLRSVLAAGRTVICDRYLYSGIAYSAAKGLDRVWCRMPDVGLPRPDLTLFFDLPPEKAKDRGGYGDERYEQLAFQQKVYAEYGFVEDASWCRIPADAAIDVVADAVWKAVSPLLPWPATAAEAATAAALPDTVATFS